MLFSNWMTCCKSAAAMLSMMDAVVGVGAGVAVGLGEGVCADAAKASDQRKKARKKTEAMRNINGLRP